MAKLLMWGYECLVYQCKKWELAPVCCVHCKLQVCLSHRHQDSHECPELCTKKAPMSNTKALVTSIIQDNQSKPKPEKKKLSRAAQKTAAKVQLMKLKMKSLGDRSLPDQERVHFLVQPPEESGKPACGCFVSKYWSLGKVIDTLAELTDTSNLNNVHGAKKLNIFRKQGGDMITAPMETKLSSLLDSETLFNGDTISLDYV